MGCDVDSIWGCGVGRLFHLLKSFFGFIHITTKEIEEVRFVWMERRVMRFGFKMTSLFEHFFG